ncbi:MAG: hypothetical protein ACR2PW_04685 [Gammaproteobacteria bacterium]
MKDGRGNEIQIGDRIQRLPELIKEWPEFEANHALRHTAFFAVYDPSERCEVIAFPGRGHVLTKSPVGKDVFVASTIEVVK